MDKIKIQNLEIFAYHGVFEDEKQKGQKFYINAELKTDLSKAGQSDDLTRSVHYGEVCEQMQRSMTEQTFNLIERAATKNAEDILLRFPLVQEITLELRKPFAPISMEFESVSVEITRGWHKVYIALGSNLGEKEKYIKEAVNAIEKNYKFRKVRQSSLYRTKPYGGVAKEEFVNGMLEAETMMNPHELLEYLHELEAAAGRVRTEHWGSRTLDLDIIFYDDLILDEPDLQIPHKDMVNRDFVLEPLAELAGFRRHPLNQKTVEELLDNLKEHYVVKVDK